MKIGILTRHSVANYGSILQSYATLEILKNMNYSPFIINYIRTEEYGKNIVKTMLKRNQKWNKYFITRKLYEFLQNEIYTKSFFEFEKYRKEILIETKKVYSSEEELKNNIPEADIYMSGSDQIWGKIGDIEYDPVYFLSFVNDKKKCISYASSFGKENINNNLKKDLKKLLKKYDSILVREESAVEIVNKAGFNAECVLDPVLLLDSEKWKSFTDVKIKDKDYVLLYQLHNNKQILKYAKKIAKAQNKKLIRVSISKYHKSMGTKLVALPSPKEFLCYINNASLVVTDSFHATAFSILFNKQFVDILPNFTATRIENLLKTCKIKNRIVKDFNNIDILNKNINYDQVNEILKRERKKSIELLKNAIEK